MIIDRLENLSLYAAINPLFADVVEFLNDHDLQTLEVGKYPIQGNNVFLNLQMAKGRSQEAAVLETHIEMIDIQIPLSAEESFGYTPLQDLPDFEYNAEKDITKYGDTKAQTYVTVKPGQFVIFFPQDGHAPCITPQAEIKKAIFKIKA
ncbi:MAG: YhcH/YjgK/YiaL family protein [Prevotella sp.]|nr:YhcH/YjgK/YiaL family protein [Prevotella sp.]